MTRIDTAIKAILTIPAAVALLATPEKALAVVAVFAILGIWWLVSKFSTKFDLLIAEEKEARETMRVLLHKYTETTNQLIRLHCKHHAEDWDGFFDKQNNSKPID